MAKKRALAPKKNLTKVQPFIWGVMVGLGLYWIPIGHQFTQTEFSQNPWSQQQLTTVFSKHPPTTSPIIQKDGYLLSYNGQTKNAHWVYHKVTPAILDKKTSREDCEFKEDLAIPESIRATKNDYQGTGFDRGHLCPAADCETQNAVEDSFFLSNIVPQVPALNRGYWKKMENHVRELAKEYKTVHVFTGPLYLSGKGTDGKRYVKYEVLGKQEIAVPTHFFMLIFVELPSNKMMHKAFILPNKPLDSNLSVTKFAVSLEEVERATGVLFTQILD